MPSRGAAVNHENDPTNAPSDDWPSPAARPEDSQDSGAAEDAASSEAVKEASSEVGRSSAGPPTGIEVSSTESSPARDTGPVLPEGATTPAQASSLAETLDLLRASVRELISRDRRTTAAPVSLEMRRRTGNAFSPASSGFNSFREFLYFAEQVGAVALVPPTAGGDVEIFPATAATQSAATVSTQQPRTVRRDLWQAFVDWSPKWQRVFDTQTNRIVRIPGRGNDGQPGGARLWEEDPSRYRRIVPFTQEDQLRWIREFVDQLNPGTEQDTLAEALKNQRPIAAFVEAISSMPGCQRAWRRTLSRRVTARITEWILEEQLAIDIYQQPVPPLSSVPHTHWAPTRKPQSASPSHLAASRQR